jgi:hypothetical protein
MSSTSKASEIATASGPARMNVNPRTRKYMSYQSTHNTGGAIMGADSATSAVNKYSQSWAVSSVFTIGARAFPQNGGTTPLARYSPWSISPLTWSRIVTSSARDHWLENLVDSSALPCFSGVGRTSTTAIMSATLWPMTPTPCEW